MVWICGRSWMPFGVPCTIPPTGPSGKSQREGLVVRLAQSEEELRAFFEMHLKVRKYKYGLLAQPYRFFQNIWRHFIGTRAWISSAGSLRG